ncbi:MAG TPA: hypothetical protein PKI00_01550 [Candidatus Pacearchaeota archaeon]|nr:hypothetical protein [Candidatus Parcubacteria bacterium]HNP79517.1 hypothetical protein [Candidatus Pacearchaeota archaeon]HOC53920.1 hypothetical protein [Candidatus Pacearchaeota archaeon]HQM24804.1 hypothetical protein [Candidatus Pacearchaeota archaeon]
MFSLSFKIEKVLRMLTFDEIKILITFASLMISIPSAMLFILLCRHLNNISPTDSWTGPVKTSYIATILSAICWLTSLCLVLQKTRIVVAIGLMITMLVASALLTGVLFSGAVIMTVKNPEKMANVKKKSNLLSGMFKLYT